VQTKIIGAKVPRLLMYRSGA